MTEIEKKALALVNEVLAEWGVLKNAVEVPKNSDAFARALLRAIEQHEAYKQEVSDAVGAALDCGDVERLRRKGILSRFIITKPVDPLVEALKEAAPKNREMTHEEVAEDFRAALAARGGRIVFDQPEGGEA